MILPPHTYNEYFDKNFSMPLSFRKYISNYIIKIQMLIIETSIFFKISWIGEEQYIPL